MRGLPVMDMLSVLGRDSVQDGAPLPLSLPPLRLELPAPRNRPGPAVLLSPLLRSTAAIDGVELPAALSLLAGDACESVDEMDLTVRLWTAKTVRDKWTQTGTGKSRQ